MKSFSFAALAACLLFGLSLLSTPYVQAQSNKPIAPNCTWKGKKLWGKIQVVEAFPDLKVQIVDAFPDLKVLKVEAFPTDCGKWQLVEAFPDLKIQFVDAFPDIKIQYVPAFPGVAP